MSAMLPVTPRNLAEPTYLRARSDQALFTVIHDGGAAVQLSSVMPAFASQLSDAEVWNAVAYIRTLGTATPSPSPTTDPAAATEGPSGLDLVRLRLSIWPEYDDTRVLVMFRGLIASQNTLPTRLALPIPNQADIIGAGIISEQDALLLHPYEVIKKASQSYLVMDVSSLHFFIELYYPIENVNRDERHFVYAFSLPYPTDILEVDIQQPLHATQFITEPAPAEQVTDQQGFVHNHFFYRDLKPGQNQRWGISYTKTTSDPSVPKPPSGAAMTPRPVPQEEVEIALRNPNTALGLLAIVAVVFASSTWLWQRFQRHRVVSTTPTASGVVTTISTSQQRAHKTVLDHNATSPRWQPLTPTPNFCSQCGHQVSPAHRFCAGCGRALQL